ncbi:MAG: PilZ domain-containing protein [Planctomycetes bacterium]|nr:PilZ domain-containing protein [Planctomycetota bacterium]MBL7042729.1 PilZ domain-containing protein [Pirellulaceae bacterium]
MNTARSLSRMFTRRVNRLFRPKFDPPSPLSGATPVVDEADTLLDLLSQQQPVADESTGQGAQVESPKSGRDASGHPRQRQEKACLCVLLVAMEQFERLRLYVRTDSDKHLASIADDVLAAVRPAGRAGSRADSPVSIRIGAARYNSAEPVLAVLKRAEQALDEAKQNGRNGAYVHNGERVVPLCAAGKGEAKDVSDPQTPRAEERRRAVRFPYRQTEQVAFCNRSNRGGPEFQDVSCLDISASGIAFMLDSKPLEDTLLMKLEGLSEPVLLLCELRRTEALADDRWRIGCEFVKRLVPKDGSAETIGSSGGQSCEGNPGA